MSKFEDVSNLIFGRVEKLEVLLATWVFLSFILVSVNFGEIGDKGSTNFMVCLNGFSTLCSFFGEILGKKRFEEYERFDISPPTSMSISISLMLLFV